MSSMRPSDSKKSVRPLRIASEIMRDLPEIFRSRVTLPDDALVSISGVTVSDDLSLAKIFFTVLGEPTPERIRHLTKNLNGQRGIVRHEIAQRLVMRQHPEIRFEYDPTPVRAARIEELLKQIREESPEGGGTEDGGKE